MKEIAAQELLQHTEFVRRVARALSADEHGADDLVQETWLTAMTGRRPDAGKLRGWLAGVTRNLARQGNRGERRRTRREAVAASAERLPSTDDVVERMEMHRRVVTAVLDLPPSSREVIVLQYFEGLRPAEVSARLGVPVETVRTRVKRARERLRLELAGHHDSRGAYLTMLAALSAPEASTAAPLAGVAALAGVAGLLGLVGAVAVVPLFRSPSDHAAPGAPELAASMARGASTPESVELESTVRPTADEARRQAAPEASEAQAEAGAATDATASTAGTLTVLEPDGTARTAEDGQLFLRLPDRPELQPVQVRFRDGRFLLEDVPAGRIQLERASTFVGSDFRPVVFDGELVHTPGEALEVVGRYLPDATLRVVDAATGVELDAVRVLPKHGYPGQRHPGPHFDSAFCVRDEPSPVTLPRDRSVRSYWVTAPGYTWTFLKVDHDTGGEREVAIERAGSLEVQLTGHDPTLAVHARIRPHDPDVPGDARASVASCLLDEGGFQGFPGLAPGRYEVSAEIGWADDPPLVVAETVVEIPAGGTARADLEWSSEAIPPSVSVRGFLALPAGYEDLEVGLIVKRAEGPKLRRHDEKRLARADLVGTDTRGVLTWNAEQLTPGRYLAIVTPVQHGVILEVPERDVDDLRIEVPPLATLFVRALDEHTGAPLEEPRLRWSRELSPGAGQDAWSHFGHADGRDAAELVVPVGVVQVAGSGARHGYRSVTANVGAGETEVVLQLPRQLSIEVVLEHDETAIPWIPGMECSWRRVGDAEFQPCGRFGEARMRASVGEPGLYEIAVGPLEEFRQPEPVVVGVDWGADSRVTIGLVR